MDLDLDELRKTAENAHSVLPEPWIVMGDSNTVSVVELSKRDGSIISGGAVADAHTTPFRDHIATFDPPTVLALLSRLEQAEQAVARVREVCETDGYEVSNEFGAWDAVAVENIIDALETN